MSDDNQRDFKKAVKSFQCSQKELEAAFSKTASSQKELDAAYKRNATTQKELDAAITKLEASLNTDKTSQDVKYYSDIIAIGTASGTASSSSNSQLEFSLLFFYEIQVFRVIKNDERISLSVSLFY